MELNAIIREDVNRIKQLSLPWATLKGAKIFCTGATGFIGNYLSNMLEKLSVEKDLGLELWLFRRTGSSIRTHIANAQWIEGDITGDFLPDDFVPNIIIHAASPANTKAYAEDPIGLFQTNILATHYLLEQARKKNSLFVFFSSAAIYQNWHGAFAEVNPADLIQQGPQFTMYAASKLGGEMLCEEYRRKYNVDCRVIRPFNIHGPGESLNCGRFFSDFLRQALLEGKIVVTGTGTPIRDSCYIMDFFSGLLYILLKGQSATYNIGNEKNTYTIFELAQQIARQAGKVSVIGPLCVTSHTAGETLVPDTTKLRQLGWRPQVNLQDCIQRCLDSYREGER